MNIPNSNEWLSLPIDSIKPYDRQLRRHDRRSISRLKKLIGQFGQVVPIIIRDAVHAESGEPFSERAQRILPNQEETRHGE